MKNHGYVRILSKEQELKEKLDSLRKQADKVESEWRLEKLKTLRPKMQKLIGKCYKTTESNDRNYTSYYKVLEVEPYYSNDNNHQLKCFFFSIDEDSKYQYGSNVYEVKEIEHMYESIISKGEITPEEFEQAYLDMLFDLKSKVV